MKFDDCCCCLPTEPVIAYNSRTRVFHGDKLIYIYIYINIYINGHDRSHNPLLAHARRGVMMQNIELGNSDNRNVLTITNAAFISSQPQVTLVYNYYEYQYQLYACCMLVSNCTPMLTFCNCAPMLTFCICTYTITMS